MLIIKEKVDLMSINCGSGVAGTWQDIHKKRIQKMAAVLSDSWIVQCCDNFLSSFKVDHKLGLLVG